MSSMIDRIAQTLHERIIANGGISRGATDMKEDARAIIEAMRLPTDAMSQAGGTTHDGTEYEMGALIAEIVWERMIDRALAE